MEDPRPESQPKKSEERDQNPSRATAWGAMLAGTALAIYGWTRKSATGAALGVAGGAIALKAASAGPLADMLRSDINASGIVLVNRSAADLYSFWKDVAKSPLWMENIESVTPIDEKHSRWLRRDALAGILEWTSELTLDIPNEMIAWRTVSDSRSGYDLTGRVDFKELGSERGTQVTLKLCFKMHAGLLQGGAVMAIAEERELNENLRRFKMLMETGEIATTRGQSHGPRSEKGKLLDRWLGERSGRATVEKSQRDKKSAQENAEPLELRIEATG
jgi:uncharacterized membrane protein